MRRANYFKTVSVMTGILFIVSAVFTQASNRLSRVQHQHEGPLTDELVAIEMGRRQLIQTELVEQPGSDWAGSYSKQDDLVAGTSLVWAPHSGFVMKWNTCCHGYREKINFGTAMFSGKVLKLNPERPESSPNSLDVAVAYTAVLWGKQHFLIPSESLVHFCYAAVNAARSPEFRSFFSKEGDETDVHKGTPEVPEEYQRFLTGKPLNGTVESVLEGDETHITEINLNIGSVENVVVGMKFYVYSPRSVDALLEVEEVHAHTSKAYLVTGSYKNGRELLMRSGYRVTSKAPRNAADFYPG